MTSAMNTARLVLKTSTTTCATKLALANPDRSFTLRRYGDTLSASAKPRGGVTPEPAEPWVRMQVMMPDSLRTRIDSEARRRGLPSAAYVRTLLLGHFDRLDAAANNNGVRRG